MTWTFTVRFDVFHGDFESKWTNDKLVLAKKVIFWNSLMAKTKQTRPPFNDISSSLKGNELYKYIPLPHINFFIINFCVNITAEIHPTKCRTTIKKCRTTFDLTTCSVQRCTVTLCDPKTTTSWLHCRKLVMWLTFPKRPWQAFVSFWMSLMILVLAYPPNAIFAIQGF
jgi:hypothetical protein